MPKANDRIGPYQLIRKLGEGGFGEVWLARDFSGSILRKVAVKMPLKSAIDLDALLQEATVWARATGHPNVLEFLTARVFDGQVALVSEYAPDGSLTDWMRLHSGRAPSVEAAVEMTRGILAGLEHLHARRIIHRDVKPENVLLSGTTPRLADFGISRLLKSTSKSAVSAGTPLYMAPEAFNRKRNQRTDLWSAGVMLYQMLSGRLPFDGNDMAELYGAILNEEPEPLPADIPEGLRQVVAKALIKEPEMRFRTAAEMRAALTPQPQPVKETPVPPPPHRTVTVDEPPPRYEPIVVKPPPKLAAIPGLDKNKGLSDDHEAVRPLARLKIINKQNATGPWNEILGLILIGIGIVILLALISYDSSDPSWNSVGGNTRARNWVGPMGAKMSDALYQAFGIAALIVPVMLFIIGRWQWDDDESEVSKPKVLGLFLMIVAFTGWVTLFNPEKPGSFYWGGYVGKWLISGPIGLARLLGNLGAFVGLVILSTLGLLLMLSHLYIAEKER